MAKIFKFTIYLVDPNEYYDNLINAVEGISSEEGFIMPENLGEEREFEWNDELEINKINCSIKEYRKYFE